MKTLPDLYSQEQLAYCQSMPKVELHAHLNGSVRDSTLRYSVGLRSPHTTCMRLE